MSAPPNWKEPGQKPEFDEYTVVLGGSLKVESQNKAYFIKKEKRSLYKQESGLDIVQPIKELST